MSGFGLGIPGPGWLESFGGQPETVFKKDLRRPELEELEFFPFARGDCLYPHDAMRDFEDWRNQFEHEGFVVLLGPPHIYEERMHPRARYGFRHWAALPV